MIRLISTHALPALAIILVSLLSACNTNETSTQASSSTPAPTPTPKPTPNPFDLEIFPKATCGDALPSNNSQYPVEFYPVYVEYSDVNLESLQSKYCGDSFKKYREAQDKDFVQVASFIGFDRASSFQDFLSREYNGIEIGDSTIISSAPRPTPTPRQQTNTPIQKTAKPSNLPSNSTSFDTVNSSCAELPARYKDVELKSCYGIGLMGKNYSVDWYEVQSPKGFSLVPPGHDGLIEATGSAEALSVAIQKIQGKPKRMVTVRCDDPPTTIWRIVITPTCNSSGTYIELGAGFTHAGSLRASILLTLIGGDTLSFTPSLGSSEGTISSTGRSVTFNLTVQ